MSKNNNTLNKSDVKDLIYHIFNYIENGKEPCVDTIYNGHPGLFFFHSKIEFENLINKCLSKDNYNCYDVFYICNYIIKYLLGKYDSHTNILSLYLAYRYAPKMFKLRV